MNRIAILAVIAVAALTPVAAPPTFAHTPAVAVPIDPENPGRNGHLQDDGDDARSRAPSVAPAPGLRSGGAHRLDCRQYAPGASLRGCEVVTEDRGAVLYLVGVAKRVIRSAIRAR